MGMCFPLVRYWEKQHCRQMIAARASDCRLQNTVKIEMQGLLACFVLCLAITSAGEFTH